MITLYLDMDGVLADFHKAYYSGRVRDGTWDKVRFRDMVMNGKVFEVLDLMPNAVLLLDAAENLRDQYGVNVEILTSVGTFDAVQGLEAKTQKQKWLMQNNIGYKQNFVRTKSEKALYATENSILIDDSHGCVYPFTQAGGHGILHEDEYIDNTLDTLVSVVLNIHNRLNFIL